MNPVASEPPTDPGAFLLLEKVRRVVVWTILACALAFVLLPLFWMILTAFKTRGTAFRLQFLPQMEVVHPPIGEPPFDFAIIGKADRFVHVEVEAPGATTVVAEQKTGAEETVAHSLRLAPGGWWFATIVNPPGTAFEYRFLVDGRSDDGWREAEVVSGAQWNDPASEPMFLGAKAFFAAGTNGFAATASAAGDRHVFLLDGKTTFDPHSDKPLPGNLAPKTVRIVERRSFGEAMGDLYTLSNFRTILFSDNFNFARYFTNSLIVATSAALLTVLLTTMAGFAFAQKRFYFKDQLFSLFLASMLVPGMIYMVPQFSITLGLGWLNSFQGMVVPHLANVFGLFLMRQYIGQIPKDLFNAAEIDGAGDARVFANVVAPVCMPVMVTLFLLVFVGQWSNFLWQLIVNTGDQATMTLPVGLQQFKGQNANDWELIMAGACFSILPIAVLFLSLQKYFLSGLTAGAVKE